MVSWYEKLMLNSLTLILVSPCFFLFIVQLITIWGAGEYIQQYHNCFLYKKNFKSFVNFFNIWRITIFKDYCISTSVLSIFVANDLICYKINSLQWTINSVDQLNNVIHEYWRNHILMKILSLFTFARTLVYDPRVHVWSFVGVLSTFQIPWWSLASWCKSILCKRWRSATVV